MADDEQFSLCWNNFNSNLSAGFHESLCRGDLVDVTLAAEGQFVKAHRLVLSVCSPYFRKMFTQMPANQHAFVFLKDVSHTALKDLIQFMYCGEVNVKQEALPAFISTAEALQIKGLTDSDPPQSQTPPEPSTPTPQIQQQQQQQQIQTSPRVRQRTTTARSYKIETVDDSGDDAKQTTQIVIQTTAPTHPPQATITTQPQQQQQHHQPQQHITQQTLHTQTHQLTSVSMPAATTTTVVTQKRPAQRTSLGSVPHIKRSKSTLDPLEAADATTATHQINVQTVVADSKPQIHHQQQHHHQQQQQQQQQHHQTTHHQQAQQQQHQQQTNEPEYIDLPIDLPTKSEPDYAEDAGEVDQAEQDANYVEDESYGDMRYDESYFTENEDAAAAAGNTTAASAQNTSATTATTSKAIVKQQPLSDSSYMDTSADPANSDAQDEADLQDLLRESTQSSSTTTSRVAVKRGRPRKDTSGLPKAQKIIEKILETINNHSGQPILYASTTKGTMKLIYDGHHFRYSFRKGSYTIFQCCYKEVKEECPVRVVTDQKLVYPLDGEHIHFVQATDKSVTSVKFTPGEETEPEFVNITAEEVEQELEESLRSEQDHVTLNVDDVMPQPITINVKEENAATQINLEFTENIATEKSSQPLMDDKPKESTDDANEFREKIKKRLQRALLGKKKQ